MADHVAPWEDEDGWTHSNWPDGYSFPDTVCRLSRYLRYPQCPEYAAKEVTENEELVHKVYVYLTTTNIAFYDKRNSSQKTRF